MPNREVGFALNNGHRQLSLAGPKSANRKKGLPIEETVVRRFYPGKLAQSNLTGSIWAVGSEAKTSSGLRVFEQTKTAGHR